METKGKLNDNIATQASIVDDIHFNLNTDKIKADTNNFMMQNINDYINKMEILIRSRTN